MNQSMVESSIEETKSPTKSKVHRRYDSMHLS